MKGMQKISRGTGFRGVFEYLLEDERGSVFGGNMSSNSVRDLAREMGAVRALRPDIKRPVWHNSLRLPAGERINDDKWREIADEYMRRMNFADDHPRAYIMHDDEDGQHIHIVASRVSLSGKVYLGQHENLASTRHIAALEREHELQITKGTEVSKESATMKKGEIERALRTGEEPPRQRLQRLIDAAVVDAPSVVELAERLESEGVVVRANLASTGTFNGFSFELASVPFKGSDLGKGYAWKGLQAKGVTYEQVRDRESLERFRPTARAAAGNDEPASADLDTDDSGRAVGPDTDAVGTRIDGPQPAAAPADARLSGADRADRAGVGSDPSKTAAAGRALGPARGGDEPGHGRPPLAGVEGRSQGAAPAGQPGRPDGLAVEGLGGEAGDILQVLSEDHKQKINAWRRQAAALGAPAYRVSLIGRAGTAEGKRINLGKQRDEGQAERFYDAAEVQALIPQLRRRNAQGFDVYVTPIDQRHHYIVIDDMKPDAGQLLADLGYAPCIVQSSSKGNEQAVLKVPRLDRPDEQALANKVVQQMNMAHGDPKFSGVVHPFRMAGFSNKKPGRESAFTRILDASHRTCRRAADLLQQLRQAADGLVERARKKREKEQIEVDAARQAQRNQDRSEIEIDFDRGDDSERAFRRAAAGVRAWVRLRGLTEDASRVDYRAAMAMLAAGWTEAEVQAGMISGSENLAGRHTNSDDYVRRTVSKASIHLTTSQASEASDSPRPSGG